MTQNYIELIENLHSYMSFYIAPTNLGNIILKEDLSVSVINGEEGAVKIN